MARIKGRWRCPDCGTCGWSSGGGMPPHDRNIGGACRPSGMITESEAKKLVANRINNEIKNARYCGAI